MVLTPVVYGLYEALGGERILAHAREQEREYNWLEAAESYGKALGLISGQETWKRGELYEQSGYALYRAAMQADSGDGFRERMHQAIANYGKAGESWGRLTEQATTARALRCEAMVSYLSYWLAPGVAEKKKMLNESWRLTKESLKAFEESGDALGYAKTHNQLSTSAIISLVLEWDFRAQEKIVREAVELGEQTITFLSTHGDTRELARAYVITAVRLNGFSSYLSVPEEQEKYYQKALAFWKKAEELSEETALLQLSDQPLGAELLGVGSDEALTNLKKTLEYARKTRDRLIIGSALDQLAYHTFWKALGTEDPDQRVGLLKGALKYAEEAKQQFSPISFISPRGGKLWVEAPNAEFCLELAALETDLEKRRELLQKAAETAPDQLSRARESGYPDAIQTAHHVVSKILASLARVETRLENKKRLLEKALEHRNEDIRITEQLTPFFYWNRGVGQDYLANITSELAGLAEDHEDKKRLLRESILTKEGCLELCEKWMPFIESTGSLSMIAVMGQRRFEYGHLSNRLYNLTGDSEHLMKAVNAFEDAAKSFEKTGLVSRMAECYWKSGQAYSSLGQHLKATESFILASYNYSLAGQKIPQLKEFYKDHASYMQAWSEIEKARYHHARQEYGSAREFYEKAAALHKLTKEWSSLTSNYSALAQVENGEDLSRREQSQEAIQAFHEAARLFREAKAILQNEVRKVENSDRKMVASLIKGADLRREYCMGRVALEEAKLLDQKGDHYSSSERYGQAAETFEKIAQALESEQDRNELRLIMTLSKAWQTMARAEVQASPGLYMEASQLFEAAKELGSACGCLPETQMLALGHSRFCKALDAGTRFADTREEALHAVAIQHLESAANYYLKAGFRNASEYTEATELLFDAYVHMDLAKKERDQEKKAKLYEMAQKVLHASAESFLKAQQPAKQEQVLRVIERVKKERELALSLTEVLHAPSFVSATAAFSAPTPTRESAVGLERFEHADVQASVITRQKQLKVGEDLDLEIELVNAGKGAAQLVKVEELIPEGFELTEKPEQYRVEDSYLNMKGKRLDPLKTEEVKLVLKSKAKGQFTLSPRILYLDESGKYRTSEPKPLEITVRELGLSGWVKGR